MKQQATPTRQRQHGGVQHLAKLVAQAQSSHPCRRNVHTSKGVTNATSIDGPCNVGSEC
jgi:hypothetical protein